MIPPYNPLIPTDIIRISATRYTIPFRFYITFTLDRYRPATATYLFAAPSPIYSFLTTYSLYFQPIFCYIIPNYLFLPAIILLIISNISAPFLYPIYLYSRVFPFKL